MEPMPFVMTSDMSTEELLVLAAQMRLFAPPDEEARADEEDDE